MKSHFIEEDIQMEIRQQNLLEKCKFKLEWDYYTPVRRANFFFRKVTPPNAEEDIKKLYHLYIADRNV